MRNMELLTNREIPASTPQAESGAGEDQRKLLEQFTPDEWRAAGGAG